MNRRTKRRLIVLAAVGGVVIVAGVGGTAVRTMRRAQIAESSRAEGMAAYEAGDYRTARGKLITHLRLAGEDAEALTALGDAQRHVEEPNAKHLLSARAYLDRAVLLDPENTRAREILLDVHELLGNWQELAEVAGALLELDPKNQRAARLRIEANLRRGNEAEAIKAARELVIARDGAIEAHLEMLRVMQRSGLNAREQREYLENEVAPQHEGTTSMAVLRATVEYDGGQPQRATTILLQAGEAGATDGPGARMLLDSLELIAATTGNTDLYQRSQGWLVAWLEDEAIAPHVLEVAAGRAWRSGLPQRAVDMAVRGIGTEPPNESVFGWGLLGAMELGLEGRDTATRLRESFDAAVDPDHAARAERWRELVEAAARIARGESAPETPLLPDNAGSINTIGPDSVGGYYDALDDAGRHNTQGAIERLAGLGQQPSWRRARLALASILQGTGRPLAAISVLQGDESLRELKGAAELFSDAWASAVEASGNPEGIDPRGLEASLAKDPDNPMLLSALGRGALARGETDRAIELARRLSAADAARAAISAIRFAQALQATDPQLAEEVIDRVAVTATTPRQVAAAASGLAGLGMADRARGLMDDRAADGLDGSAYDWSLARILLANAIGDEKGLETLERISAEAAGDPRIHIEILNASAIWTQLDAAGRVIARLREAQGDGAIEWRIFEARRLLEADGSVENANAAASVLGVVFGSDRGKRDTRAMLIAADAFERAGPLDSELQALGFAADGNDPLAALPRLIDRLQSLGRGAQAATRLGQFADMDNIPPDALALRAQLLQRQGLHERASRDIAVLASAGYPMYVLRAGVMRREPGSDVPLTEPELRALEADLSPRGEIHAAQLLARVGRFEDGLARLEALPATSEAGSRAVIVAQFLAEQGLGERALAYLTGHAEATGDPDAWMEAARMLVGQMRVDEATALLDRAAAALPGNAAIAAFRTSIAPDSAASPFDRMAQFAASAADREDANESMRELGAIAKRYVAGQVNAAQAARDLDELAGRRATFYPLWPLLVAVYQHLDQPSEALRRARDAVAALPGDPRPARDATQLMLGLERFDEALGMAGRWRSLAIEPRSRAEADMALGVAEYRLGNAERAIGLLLPLRDQMLADARAHELPLRSLAEALSAADRMAEAEDILMPLARESAGWAAFMASAAVIAPDSPANTERAARWLETLTPLLADHAPGTVYAASTYMVLFNRTHDTAFADRAVALAQSADRAGRASWPLVATLATALEAKAEYGSAVAAYERAMEMAGSRVPALLNNAAWLLTSELGEHARAVTMAREAVSASSGSGFSRSDRAVFHHTLGAALLASGDSASALRAFEDGLQLAQTPSLGLGRVEALLAGNRRAEAIEAYGRLRPDDGWSEAHHARYEAIGKLIRSG